MERKAITFDIETVPQDMKPYLTRAAFYDSSCSADAKTLFVAGADRAFLKISPRGTLEREYKMAHFLHKHRVAPVPIAYESDSDHDYLLTEAVDGEDGTAVWHIDQPSKLASVFGEYLRMLHAIPADGCPYGNRTSEWLHDAHAKGIDLRQLSEIGYTACDNVVIHGDYCLPNVIMDHFAFKSFIDLGQGGIGDRHYDLYWGIWTLEYNLKTDRYRNLFLDAYGRDHVDEEGLHYFAELIQLTDTK